MTSFILIRHCEATGQQREAPLTPVGFEQAKKLAELLKRYTIHKIISSPFTRAIQTITPYATSENMDIEVDERLQERILSSEHLPDWLNKLQRSFEEPDLKFVGGESSNEAEKRIVTVVEELIHTNLEHIVLVTHGNLAALLLHSISPSFSFEQWQKLSNPDVYIIEIQLNERSYQRIWQ